MTIVEIALEGVAPFQLEVHRQGDLHVSAHLRRHRIWEPGNTAFLIETLRPGDRVIDGGAHVGYFTVLMSQLVGAGGHVLAFEPEAGNFALLERNLARNRLANVTIERKALADRAGPARLYLSPDNGGDHRLHAAPEERATQEVEAVTLDGYLEGDKQPVRFVKLDTQGQEPRILDGMARLIERNRRWLTMLIEFTPGMMRGAGCEVADFLRRLEALDAVVLWLGEGRRRPWLTRATLRDLRGIADMMMRTSHADHPAELVLRFNG